MKKVKVSLNLGGGSARGFAHIGAIRSLVEEKIHFDMIIGVSAGAFVGSLYASKPDVDYLTSSMIDMVRSKEFNESLMGSFNQKVVVSDDNKNILEKVNRMYTKGNLLGKMFLSEGLMTREEINNVMFKYIPNVDIRDTVIPFACVAVELYEGSKSVFRKGNLRDCVMASMSLPMVCPPVVINAVHYVDGGILDKVGIVTAKELKIPDIIAVDVSNQTINQANIRNALDVLLRTEEISAVYRRKWQTAQATILIQPITQNIHWADFSQYKELIDVGYEATRTRIDEIRQKLKLTSPFRKIYTMFHRKGFTNASVIRT